MEFTPHNKPNSDRRDEDLENREQFGDIQNSTAEDFQRSIMGGTCEIRDLDVALKMRLINEEQYNSLVALHTEKFGKKE